MNSSPTDYGRIFNRLCHLMALTKQGTAQAVIADLVLKTMVIDDSCQPTCPAELVQAIDAYFGIQISERATQSALDRLLADQKALRDPHSKIYYVSASERSHLDQMISQARDLEVAVRQEWLAQVDPQIMKLATDTANELWACLQHYMAKVFQRHGVETIRLLTTTPKLSDTDRRGFDTYLDLSIEACCANVPAESAAKSIRMFFNDFSTIRTKYISQLLDATFTFFALSNDETTADYIKRNVPDLRIFLDTNFIFGVLGLHDHPLVEISQELVGLIKEHNLPFHLYYHEETLAEIQRTLEPIKDRLLGRKWQQSVSRAAVHSKQLTGLEYIFHEKNAQSPLDPQIFLSPYDGIMEMLKSYGFTIFRERIVDVDRETFETGELVARYKEYIEQRRRPKPYEALNHDMVVWRAANRLRKKAASLLDLGALFLTADYYLFCFDWQQLKAQNEIAITVLPHLLIQVLRPFIPATDDFDRHFVEAFALPEFRAMTNDYSGTYSKVLSYLNTYEGMAEKLATKILAKSVILEPLSGLDEDSSEFREIVDHALTQEYNELAEEKEAVKMENVQVREQLAQLRSLLATAESAVEDASKGARKLEEEAQRKTDSIKQKVSLLEEEKRDQAFDFALLQKRYSILTGALRWVSALILGVFLIIGIFILPETLQWKWLLEHSNRLGLQLCGTTIVISLCLAIMWPKRWKYFVSPLGLGAFLVVLQIIGK